ncbi:hypothetical protein BDY21DRAFT_402111 [Lineolata rhizophorae]|uniref:Arrestin-like N-terminal domain-containing protein n=1 Tax=Lineolata rhizophorae TaxID=578093 RepID=A0A6A6NP20_9PEZI|nr:hypothetical protein BDY21DRAFT_402111 [Lineolata rhizophorae]
MIVQIILDRPHSHYTNLDIISGRIQLRTTTNASVSSIVVKLEGESRTRLLPPPKQNGGDRQKYELEVHKLLYKVNTVFPPANVKDSVQQGSSFTLQAGQHEYPFEFKFPFNNSCSATNNLANNINIVGMQLELAKTPAYHVKKTLPPTLSGFPGEAEIKYYVKVTVNRPQFYKENSRAYSVFPFLPIEPPRPSHPDGEVYARQKHQFQLLQPALTPPGGPRKESFFKSLLSKTPSSQSTPGTPSSPTTPDGPQPSTPASPTPAEPPRFSIDARLPNPAILTRGEPLPLRLVATQLSPASSRRGAPLFMQILHVELIGYTDVRAHGIRRRESSSWVLVSLSNMGVALGDASSPAAAAAGAETVVPDRWWADRRVPATVAPSFETCNLARCYDLEVRVGLGFGSRERGKDQLVVLPLRLPVQVLSGIAPPPALLKAMEHAGTLRPAAPPMPPRPSATSASGLPAQSAAGYEDAPPSYEDAIAEELPPVDGPRRDYESPASGQGGMDEGGLGFGREKG